MDDIANRDETTNSPNSSATTPPSSPHLPTTAALGAKALSIVDIPSESSAASSTHSTKPSSPSASYSIGATTRRIRVCLREMSGSGAANSSASALDMKSKAASAAAATAVELMHHGTSSQSQSQSQKIKKCAFNSENIHFSKLTRKTAKHLIESNAVNTTTAIVTNRRQTANSRTRTTTAKNCRLVAAKVNRNSSRNRCRNGSRSSCSSSGQKLQQQLTLTRQRHQLARLEQEEAELQQRQQLYATTKENFLLTLDLLAVVRRNASDKLRLIQMVHDNPILWDSRLPNFKGAEEEKSRAWELIGKEFNAPGRRVARAFKSLRESYRRELAHVKLMGNGFKPKWSLYDAMDFLRDVIRERKGGSHAVEQPGIGLNLSAFSQHLNNNNNSSSKSALKLGALHSSFNESTALNLSKCAPGLNMNHEDYYYFVKPELDMPAATAAAAAAAAAAALAAHATSNGGAVHPLPAHQSQHQQAPQHPHHQQQPHQQQQQPQSTAHDSRVSSTRNDSTTQHSANFDDLDASSVRSGDEASVRNATALSNQGSDEVEELEAIDADFPYPLILDSNSPRCVSVGGGIGGVVGQLKRKRRDMNGDVEGGGIDEDDDDYEGQMLMQHRHLRQQSGGGGGGGGGLGGCMMDMAPPQTVREVLNSKFCGFISAKLNSMEDTEADNLMNKILMLLVQTQGNEAK